tara:strand:+ start:234 stop:668 length:435 start_codon:yes stop_codon:yes gene_type:complete
MNDKRNYVLKYFKKFFNEKDSINIEKSIYNFSINFAESKNITPSWENNLFYELYKNKAFLIKEMIKLEKIEELMSSGELKAKDISSWNPQETDEDLYQDVEEGLFVCNKCGSKKTTYYSLQTRSADEPMTNFITCVSCKNRWRM